MPENIDEMITEARRIEEDVLFSEKGHFSCVQIWTWPHYLLGICTTIFAAAAGVTAYKQHTGIAVVLAVLVAVLSALMTFLAPEKKVAVHHSAGTRYNALRGKLRRLYKIDMKLGADTTALREQLENLARERVTVTAESPPIGTLGYWLAKRSIQRGENSYSVDANSE